MANVDHKLAKASTSKDECCFVPRKSLRLQAKEKNTVAKHKPKIELKSCGRPKKFFKSTKRGKAKNDAPSNPVTHKLKKKNNSKPTRVSEKRKPKSKPKPNYTYNYSDLSSEDDLAWVQGKTPIPRFNVFNKYLKKKHQDKESSPEWEPAGRKRDKNAILDKAPSPPKSYHSTSSLNSDTSDEFEMFNISKLEKKKSVQDVRITRSKVIAQNEKSKSKDNDFDDEKTQGTSHPQQDMIDNVAVTALFHPSNESITTSVSSDLQNEDPVVLENIFESGFEAEEQSKDNLYASPLIKLSENTSLLSGEESPMPLQTNDNLNKTVDDPGIVFCSVDEINCSTSQNNLALENPVLFNNSVTHANCVSDEINVSTTSQEVLALENRVLFNNSVTQANCVKQSDVGSLQSSVSSYRKSNNSSVLVTEENVSCATSHQNTFSSSSSSVESSNRIIYVGNLEPSVTEDFIMTLFGQLGELKSCKSIKNPLRNPYFFLEFNDHVTASNAIILMNGTMLENRKMLVNWANGVAKNKYMTVDTSHHHHIYIGDLSHEIDNQTLLKAFKVFGEISDCKIVPQTDSTLRYGFVTFVKKIDAINAIRLMNGQYIGSNKVNIEWAKRKSYQYSWSRR